MGHQVGEAVEIAARICSSANWQSVGFNKLKRYNVHQKENHERRRPSKPFNVEAPPIF